MEIEQAFCWNAACFCIKIWKRTKSMQTLPNPALFLVPVWRYNHTLYSWWQTGWPRHLVALCDSSFLAMVGQTKSWFPSPGFWLWLYPTRTCEGAVHMQCSLRTLQKGDLPEEGTTPCKCRKKALKLCALTVDIVAWIQAFSTTESRKSDSVLFLHNGLQPLQVSACTEHLNIL